MTSLLLALLVRTLRESARSRLTYGLRAGVVLTAAIGIFITGKFVGWTGAPGLEVFRTLCWTQLLFIIMAGLTSFATAISEEKEDGTLDLLRLANLGPISILIGKSGNRLVTAALLLAAPLPLALLATTLGGLTSRQILASQLAVGAFLFLICQVALLCSVIAARGPMATLLSCLAIFGYLALATVLPMLGKSARFLGAGQIELSADQLAGTLWNMLPWVRLEEVFTTNFSGPLLGPEVWSYLSGGVVCFLLACLVFGRFCGENEGFNMQWQVLWIRGLRSAKTRERVWLDAVAWKDHHFIHGGWVGVWVRALLGAVLLVVFAATTVGQPGLMMRLEDFAWLATGVLLFGLMLDLALSAARAFRSEISGHTLAGLALTRIEPGYLVRCKITRAVRAAWPTGVWLALTFGAWFAAQFSENTHYSAADIFGPVILLIAGTMIGGLWLWPLALLIVKLTAWLSLRMPHGAPLLGIAIVFAGSVVLAGLALFTLGLSLFGLPIAALFLGFKLERGIVERLDQLIAED